MGSVISVSPLRSSFSSRPSVTVRSPPRSSISRVGADFSLLFSQLQLFLFAPCPPESRVTSDSVQPSFFNACPNHSLRASVTPQDLNNHQCFQGLLRCNALQTYGATGHQHFVTSQLHCFVCHLSTLRSFSNGGGSIPLLRFVTVTSFLRGRDTVTTLANIGSNQLHRS